MFFNLFKLHNHAGEDADRSGLDSVRQISSVAIATCLVLAFAVHWHLAGRWSANPDEMPHLCAGLGYIHAQDFYHYSVNPPLVKNLAAIPLWLGGTRGPILGESPGRPEFDAGWSFAGSSPESGWIGLVAGRRLLFFFTLVGALGIYRLTAHTLGRISAALAVCIWLTLPPVVGQGAMIQCDIAAAAVGILAVSSFYLWIQNRSWRYAIEAGTLLGIAIATKYTWFALIYILISWQFIEIVRGCLTRAAIARFVVQVCVIHVIAFLVIGIAFQFHGWGSTIAQSQWRSATFQKLADAESHRDGTGAIVSVISRLPIPLPRPVLVGLDIQLHDLERPVPAFYLGRWHERGSWVYYPATLAAKLPIPILIFGGVGLLACYRRGYALALLYTPTILLGALMTSSKMNEHVRYAYVVLPFVAIAAAAGVQACWELANRLRAPAQSCTAVVRSVGESQPQAQRLYRLSGRVSQLLVIGGLAVAILAAPSKPADSFSYSNRLFGNTTFAGQWVGGSAVDWDHAWVEVHCWAEKLDLQPEQFLTVPERWTPLTFSGWQLKPYPHDSDLFREPVRVLIPVYQRQKLEYQGWRCFPRKRLESTIMGGIEVYRFDSAETLAACPPLFVMRQSEIRR